MLHMFQSSGFLLYLIYWPNVTKGKIFLSFQRLEFRVQEKSTLLNTMFGLQFNVSAGRCTRGAFFQLLPVKKSSARTKCDYILIVDTEGLPAPGLDSSKSVKHDNELATFAIGLADVSIITSLEKHLVILMI